MQTRRNAPDILFIRHGETESNDRNIIDGQLVDAPLTERGVDQVYAQAHFLLDNDVPITKIFASDLRRTQTTAEIIREVYATRNPDIEIVSDARLREIHMGRKEGMPRPGKFLSNMAARWMRGVDLPLAKGGESHVQVYERLTAFYREELRPRLRKIHRQRAEEQGMLLVVSHDLPIQIMTQLLNRNTPVYTPKADAMANTEVCMLDTRSGSPFFDIIHQQASLARRRIFVPSAVSKPSRESSAA